MEDNVKAATVYKLAQAGERAGFSIDDMIRILKSGLSVEILLALIEWRLRVQERITAVATGYTSALIM
jgi:hypothetical protein